MGTVIRLGRHSERFAASGGIGARTTRRALGAHTLGFWELFLRETLQNSWDARRSSDGPITFSVSAWTATTAQRSYLRDLVLTEPPPLLLLEPALDAPDLDFLVVSDGGTFGLSGPTRSDVDLRSGPDGRSDFVDFVRDTGRRADKGYAGGTYGFGKAVLCEASAVSTIVIYTRTAMGGQDGSRFIAMAVGDNEYSEYGVRYTGRHWWGDVRGQVAEPLLGADADTAAFNLGMYNLIRGFTGTAILVVAPHTPGAPADEDLDEITADIAHAAAEYAWPHMLTGRESIDLKVTCRGQPVSVPTPETDSRLRIFADAFTRCERIARGGLAAGDAWPWHDRVLRSERPAKQLGTLAWRQATTTGAPSNASAEPRSQVALIRNPHFVVTYRDAPTDPSGRETFGVFLAAPDLDDKYAASEPPTHDAWIPAKGTHFDPARRVLKQITEEIKERPKLDQSRGAGGYEPGVVSIASALGVLLDGQTAIGDSRILLVSGDSTRDGRDQTASGGQAARYGHSEPTRASGTFPATDSQNRGDSDFGQDTARTSRDSTDPGDLPRAALLPAEADDVLSTGVVTYLRAPTTRLTGEPKLCMYWDVVAAEFPFILGRTKNLSSIVISATPSVFVDGGKENEPPIGASIPRILAWRDLSTGVIVPGVLLELTQPIPIHWSVLVSQLPDAAVGVDVVVERFE